VVLIGGTLIGAHMESVSAPASAPVTVESRIAAELERRKSRVTTIALVGAFTCIGCAAWYMWPALAGNATMMERLAPVTLMLAAGVLMQDLVELDSRGRSRLGASASIVWPPLMVASIAPLFADGVDIGAALSNLIVLVNGDTVAVVHGDIYGRLLLLIVAVIFVWTSQKLLSGSLDAQRYRGLATLGGFAAASALVLAAPPPSLNPSAAAAGFVLFAAGASSGYDIFTGDPNKGDKRRFGRRLDTLELRILELQAKGVNLDQSSSLVRNARDVGYLDPETGFKILSQAEDEINRTLALGKDIGAIRAVSAAEVEAAEDIAVGIVKPGRSLEQGDRERDLGSLREAEMLYRRAKTLASDIIEHWQRAEDAISKAEGLVKDLSGGQHKQLHDLLAEAKLAMEDEAPKIAAEISETIPMHVANLGEAATGSEDAVADAKQALEGAEGLDMSLWEDRFEQAKVAQDEGNFSLARGLSDGIVREVKREGESMTEVQRALRQRKHLVERWQGRGDAEDWDARLIAVEGAGEKRQWSHAASLLDRLTADLNAVDAAAKDAGELLAFVQDEWASLRKKLEAAGIKAKDGERKDCEKAVANAAKHHEAGEIDACLDDLSNADSLMEKLRRRV